MSELTHLLTDERHWYDSVGGHITNDGFYAREFAKRLDEARARIEELGRQLESDRTVVADGITKIRKALDSRDWLTEGRGPYEWDDDKWHTEFAVAATEIRDALNPLAKVAADWENCPKSAVAVADARIDLRARIAELEREQRWIPVEESLPKAWVGVLSWSLLGSVMMVHYRGDETWGLSWGIHPGDADIVITHWRPLPSPPPEGKL